MSEKMRLFGMGVLGLAIGLVLGVTTWPESSDTDSIESVVEIVDHPEVDEPEHFVVYRGHMDVSSGNEAKGIGPYFFVNKEIPVEDMDPKWLGKLEHAASQRRDGTELEVQVAVDKDGKVVAVELEEWFVPPPPDRTTK